MRKYLAFFRLRFSMGLQYRAAALAGMSTQLVWGLMEILMFRAFYRADASAFPMSLEATSAYVWLQQAFLAFHAAMFMENEIFESISNGNIVYELCRPVNIYNMWFSRNLAKRVSSAALRCMPILLIAVFLPAPYGLMPPVSFPVFLLFLFSLLLWILVTVSFCMLIYMASFFTISHAGIRMAAFCAVDFFSGAVIPLPFFPDRIRQIFELLPFAAMQNVPLRIYSGDLSGSAMWQALFLQCFWFLIMAGTGRAINAIAMKKVTVQGG